MTRLKSESKKKNSNWLNLSSSSEICRRFDVIDDGDWWIFAKKTCVTFASPGDETSLNLLLISFHSYGELFDPGRRHCCDCPKFLVYQGVSGFYFFKNFTSPCVTCFLTVRKALFCQASAPFAPALPRALNREEQSPVWFTFLR